ncbi:UrcA family protein [Rhizorhabdus dicambivorans]|uniref:UrcA family protein n=1 Tax=Rhizorhabdus dicambivorans TaxID=1850238 RepID=A0A2A4FX64_9SPHN|nr:UrcA family protein [Rhizorhabdus dicambivorans]ATE65922.1 UrcA family protein [Rhizorhabdus dicambivorans]PCE43039.1 UrcA family protein [Rhizorhabdus dicambivorans]
MQSFKNTVAASFAVVATFITVAAATPLRAEPVSVPVAYGDLNVASDTGAAKLDARIRKAAYQACGASDLGTSIKVANCRRDAIGAAKAKLAVNKVSDLQLAAR